MAKVSLKNIIGKKNEVNTVFQNLVFQMHAEVWVEDYEGKIISGAALNDHKNACPVLLDDELLGWVKGDDKAQVIADLLMELVKKEAEKKRLGAEVLNLYQEVNLIFNFSEKLAQTIDPAAIAATTLDEASHVIRSDNGVVILWDEVKRKLQVFASKGGHFFEEEQANKSIGLLLHIAFSGQSEIVGDTAALAGAGLILPEVKSLIYSSLKVKRRIMGAVILGSNEAAPYSAGDLKLLTTLALQSSSAIESALLYEKNIKEAREKEEAIRRLYEVTEKFVPFEFIRSLGHQVITDVKLGDQAEKIVTVLFSDIRDYTTLSEQMTPEENFSFVCSFNERMGPIIRKYNGFINQYLGDAIMAIFPGDAADALSAAIEMQQAVQEFNIVRQASGQAAIRIGVGMHTGPLIMGITGDESRLDATTISDTVNTASRIENLTKYFKASLIISDATLRSIGGAERFHLRPLGRVQVKGRMESIAIHECFSGNPAEQVMSKEATLQHFKRGIMHYVNKSFEDACNEFRYISAINPEDHTVHFFLNKAIHFINAGVPENWVGVEEMHSK